MTSRFQSRILFGSHCGNKENTVWLDIGTWVQTLSVTDSPSIPLSPLSETPAPPHPVSRYDEVSVLQNLNPTGLWHSPWLTKSFWGGLNHDELKGYTTSPCLLNTPSLGRHSERFLPFTWKGITRLTASPTLRMYVCFRCLGMRIFGSSGEGWRSVGVQLVWKCPCPSGMAHTGSHYFHAILMFL